MAFVIVRYSNISFPHSLKVMNAVVIRGSFCIWIHSELFQRVRLNVSFLTVASVNEGTQRHGKCHLSKCKSTSFMSSFFALSPLGIFPAAHRTALVFCDLDQITKLSHPSLSLSFVSLMSCVSGLLSSSFCHSYYLVIVRYWRMKSLELGWFLHNVEAECGMTWRNPLSWW